MKTISIFNNLGNSAGTVILITIMFVGFLTWSAGIFIALVILLCAAVMPPAVDFLIINPITKLINLINKSIEAYKK